MSRIQVGVAALALCASAFGVALHAQPPQPQNARSRWTPQQAQQLARDAYVFGYPLVTMELTRRQLTNVAKPDQMRAPIGQFAHMRIFPTPDMTAVTTPNSDTLNSSASLGLSKGDVVLEIPRVPSAIHPAFELVRVGGRVQMLGIPSKPNEINHATEVIFKGITIYGVVGRRMYDTWHQVTRFLRSGMFDPTPVITHRFPLEQFDEAINAIKTGAAGKVIFEIA